MRNRVIVALEIVAALVVIAVLALTSFIDVNHIDRRQSLSPIDRSRTAAVALAAMFHWEPMRLRLFPLAFRIDNAAIGGDPQFNTGRPFAQVQTLFARPKLLLLHHDVEIKSSRKTQAR